MNTNTADKVLAKLVGKYLNRYGWSDIEPIGLIIGTKGKTKVMVQRVVASQNKVKMEFMLGGFSAICVNQSAQDYDYELTNEIIEVRISKSFLKSVRIEDNPRKYFDYNF